MGVFTEALRQLIVAGLTGETLCMAMERIESANAPKRTSNAERQASYRERKGDEKRYKALLVTTSVTEPPPPDGVSLLSPHTPHITLPLNPLPVKPSEAKASSGFAPTVRKIQIQFDFETGKFTGLESYFPIWKAACPAVNLEAEIAAAGAWLIENPENRKSKYAAFLGRWLRKAQERAPRIKTGPPNSPMSLTFAEQNKIKNQQVIEEARRKYETQPA